MRRRNVAIVKQVLLLFLKIIETLMSQMLRLLILYALKQRIKIFLDLYFFLIYDRLFHALRYIASKLLLLFHYLLNLRIQGRIQESSWCIWYVNDIFRRFRVISLLLADKLIIFEFSLWLEISLGGIILFGVLVILNYSCHVWLPFVWSESRCWCCGHSVYLTS